MFKKRGRIFAGILAVMLAFSSGGISALADEPGQAEEQSAQTPEENEQTEEVKETEDIKETEEIKEVEETEEIEETATRTETDEEDNLQETDNVRDLVVSETENTETEYAETEHTETEETETDSIETYSASSANLENAKVQGEAPQGTTINLFDYWQDTQDAPDDANHQDPTNLTSGINAGAALKFGKGMSTNANLSPQDLNAWTNSEAVRQGIVQRVLTDGYPQLTKDASPDGTGKDLSYLFNPSMAHDGKASYPGVDGLLQIDEEGYYYYDSRQTFAEYDQTTRKFNLYEGSYRSNKNNANVGGAVLAAGSSPDGQFFPFNKAEEVYKDDGNNSVTLDDSINSVNKSINHYFGMTMSTRFFQQNEGKTTDGTPVTYEFAGDDDVWVFIDDVLVADLGGIHDRATLKIDFSTGEIVINERTDHEKSSTLKEQFADAGKDVSGSEWKGYTFADGTYHTLSFFYLERGNTDSNLYLKFNLVTILESGVIKVDQAGNKIPGAQFALYEATKNDDDSYTTGDLICSGTTDAAGELIFRNPEDDSPISLKDIYNNGDVKYLVLKETKVPGGYRSAGDMQLRFVKTHNGEVFLLSDNHWDTGAYAAAKVTATTDGATIKLWNSNEEIKLDKANGTLFAVVMQRQDMNEDVTDENNWRPVYGDPLDGWHVVQAENGGVMEAVLEAARENPYVFKHPQENSSLYSADIENLPGDITKYYFVLNKSERNDAEYTVGYYYTKEATLAAATTDNTYRVDSTDFGRNFSANLYVPNIQNNLYVQKLDEDGIPVSAGADQSRSAEFTLYPKNNVTPGQNGTYTVRTEEGSLKVNTSDMTTPLPLSGGAMFRGIPNGDYYLIETRAPDGYKKSTDIVEVVVGSTGVYANAGTAQDDITVERGVGSIVHSMIQFAADDDVDKTLHDIKTELYTSNDESLPAYDSNSWTPDQEQKEIHFQFQEDSKTLNYRTQESEGKDYGYYIVNSGWSKLKILQCIEDHDLADNYDPTEKKKKLGTRDLTQLFSGTVVVQMKNVSVGQLTISKKVVNNTGVDATEPEDGFSFTLTGTKEDNTNLSGTFNAIRTSGGSTPTSTNEKISFTDGQATMQLKQGESLTLKGLPTGAEIDVAENTYTDYKTAYKDVTAQSQTKETSNLQPVTIQQDKEHKVEVTNTYHLEGDFTFTKIERKGEGDQAVDAPLSGAVFAVYKLECTQPGNSPEAGHDHENQLIEIEDPDTGEPDEACWELVGTPVTSDADGTVVIKNIPVLKSIQEYRLVELKAPPGFTRPQGQWKLKYDSAGKKFVPVTGTTTDPNSASVGNPPAIEEASEGGTTTTYKIRNYKPGELPFSGNTGIRMFLLLGGGLMLLGAAGGYGWYVHKRHHTVRRRRRVRRR